MNNSSISNKFNIIANLTAVVIVFPLFAKADPFSLSALLVRTVHPDY